jgi:hypothetical protein
MSRSLLVSILLPCAPLLHAQSVVITSSVLTAVPCHVAVGAQVQTQTLPTGALAAIGSIGPTLSGPAFSSAQLGWMSSPGTTAAEFSVTTYTQLAAAGQARVGPGEIVVTFAGVAPSAMAVRFEGSGTFASSGASVLSGIDVGNDGTVDWNGGSGLPLAGSVADLTTQPLVMRLIFDHFRTVPGVGTTTLKVRVVPADVHVLRLPTNCGVANAYSVGALFDTTFADLEIRAQYSAWHLVGLQAQPALLPPSLTLTPLPCLVMPSPDALLRTGTLFLAVPQAVRPIALYTQLLDFAGGLRVSDAFQILVL